MLHSMFLTWGISALVGCHNQSVEAQINWGCVLLSWVLLSGQFCAQWFMLWQTANFVSIPYLSGGFLTWGFEERSGADRQFWFAPFELEGLQFGLIVLLTSNCFVFLLPRRFSFRVYKVWYDSSWVVSSSSIKTYSWFGPTALS